MDGDRDHEDVLEALAAHALGAVGDAEGMAIDTHVAGCDRCRHELGDLRAVVALMRSVGIRRTDRP